MPRRGQRPVQFDCTKGQQCTARSKRSGERCRNYACQDRETCRMHGAGQSHLISLKIQDNLLHEAVVPTRLQPLDLDTAGALLCLEHRDRHPP